MMAALTFTDGQKQELRKLGLSDASIIKLEKTLLSAKRRMDALDGDVPRMQHVRGVLTKLRDVLMTALEATMPVMHPETAAECEASSRVMMADQDSDPAQDDEAIKNAFRALTKAHDVLDQALAELPTEERRKRTDTRILKWVDRALQDGRSQDIGIIRRRGDTGMTLEEIQRTYGLTGGRLPIEPSRGGAYKEIMRIYFDALDPTGVEFRDPDQAIRNHIENERKARALRLKKVVGAGGQNE